MKISIPQDTQPERQGFYKVTLRDGSKCIAEWREYNKKEGKLWWKHVGEKPTDEKKPVKLEGVVYFEKASKIEIGAALSREPTEAELIEEAYKKFCAQHNIYPRRVLDIPESRKLHIGQEVAIGALADCTVRGLFEDGQVAVVRYTSRNRDGQGTIGYNAWFWHTMVPKASERAETRFNQSRVFDKVRATSRQADSLVRWYLESGLQDETPYQRDYVWTDDDKDRFLDAVVEGRPLGAIVVLNRKWPNCDELVDGKQRLHCLVEFMTSQRPYRGVYWHELNRLDQHVFEDRTIPLLELQEGSISEAEICEIFLAINAAGVPQTEEHLRHVRELRQRLLQSEAKT